MAKLIERIELSAYPLIFYRNAKAAASKRAALPGSKVAQFEVEHAIHHPGGRAPRRVFRASSLMSLPVTHAKACRDRPGDKDQWRKRSKDVRGKFDPEVALGQNTMQAKDCIAAKMACRDVFRRIEGLIGRHGQEQAPVWFQNRVDEPKSGSFIFDMFQHIEKADRCGAPGRQVRIFQPCADYRVNSAGAGGQSAIYAGLDQNALNACRDKSLRNITVAAANIKEHSAAMGTSYELQNHQIAVPEPE